MTFDEYTSSLEFVTMIGADRDLRITAAYCAGYRSTHPDSAPPAAFEADTGGYLYDRLQDAWMLGASA